MHVCGVPLTNPTPTQPPGGVPLNQKKCYKNLTNSDILISFKDLKFVQIPPPMDECLVWWVGGWIGGLMGQIVLNQ